MYIRSGTLLARPVDHPLVARPVDHPLVARPVDHPLDDTGLVVFAAPGWSR